MSNAQTREKRGLTKGEMKGLRKVLPNGSAILKEWTAKRVYVRECMSSCFVGRPRKRWINSTNDYLKKKKRFEYWARKDL